MKKTSQFDAGGPGAPGQTPPDTSQAAGRRARAAEALRQNLRRRKAQARGRKTGTDSASPAKNTRQDAKD